MPPSSSSPCFQSPYSLFPSTFLCRRSPQIQSQYSWLAFFPMLWVWTTTEINDVQLHASTWDFFLMNTCTTSSTRSLLCCVWFWSTYPWLELVLGCAEQEVLSTSARSLCSEGHLEGLPWEMSPSARQAPAAFTAAGVAWTPPSPGL